MMKKDDMKGIRLYVASPFGTKVMMVKDSALYRKYYRALTNEDSSVNEKLTDGVTHQLETDDDMVILIGWFRPWKISTLAHECSHAAFRICGKHGVMLESDNNETHAYLLGDMMDEFMKVRK